VVMKLSLGKPIQSNTKSN